MRDLSAWLHGPLSGAAALGRALARDEIASASIWARPALLDGGILVEDGTSLVSRSFVTINGKLGCEEGRVVTRRRLEPVTPRTDANDPEPRQTV